MGQRMVARLLRQGYPVTVWNRSHEPYAALAEQGAAVADSPSQAATGADIVISMLRDDVASRAVWLDGDTGAMRGLGPHSLAIECSTLSLAWCRELADTVIRQGGRFADAPVLGSRPQAEAGQLIHLVGCEMSDLQPVSELFAATAAAVKHCGPAGSGMLMKLAANALFAMQVGAFSEVIGLLNGQNMETGQAAELLADLPITSPVAKGVLAGIAAANFAPQFPVELAYKDIGYALDAAQQVGSRMPVSTTIQGLFGRTIAEGRGGENINALVQLYQG